MTHGVPEAAGVGGRAAPGLAGAGATRSHSRVIRGAAVGAAPCRARDPLARWCRWSGSLRTPSSECPPWP